MQAEHKTIPKWRKIIKEASSSRTRGRDHIIRPDPTRQFNDHNASGAMVTEPASQVELSWVGSGNAITLIAQLNWTEKLPVFSHEWSELHNWQKTGDFWSSWVIRVSTSSSLIRLNSTGQLSDHSAQCQLSWVGSEDVITAYDDDDIIC